MTASTPPLVDVIAEAIEAHERRISQSLHQGCICGWIGKAFGFDHAAHQARAVLDALTEAGGVEWGVVERPTMAVTLEMTQRIAHPVSRGDAFNAVKTKGSVYTGVVSRITGPWTAVEGS